jgi:hypothetical protein
VGGEAAEEGVVGGHGGSVAQAGSDGKKRMGK